MAGNFEPGGEIYARENPTRLRGGMSEGYKQQAGKVIRSGLFVFWAVGDEVRSVCRWRGLVRSILRRFC